MYLKYYVLHKISLVKYYYNGYLMYVHIFCSSINYLYKIFKNCSNIIFTGEIANDRTYSDNWNTFWWKE